MTQPLFPGDETGHLTEQRVQECLVDINPYLWAAVVNPFDDLRQRRRDDSAFRILTEGETAQWLRPQIIQRAKTIFEHNDSVRAMTVRQQQFFAYRDEIAICFKKLTERQLRSGTRRMERSNYMTKQNMDFWQQREVSGFPDLPRIVVGYEFQREMTDVRVLIAYPRSRHRGFVWLYEMDNQDAQLERIAEEHVVHGYQDDVEEPGFIVRPRRRLPETGTNG